MTHGFRTMLLLPVLVFLACGSASSPSLSGDVPFPPVSELESPDFPAVTDARDAASSDVVPSTDAKDAVPADSIDVALPDPGKPDVGGVDVAEDSRETADPGPEEDLSPDPGPMDVGLPDSGSDLGSDACESGTARAVSCGLNGNGTQSQVCVAGAWTDEGICDDPDACVNDAALSFSCGLNGRGTRVDSCVAGQWVQGTCIDPDVCVDGKSQNVPCGPGGASKTQTCVAGQWQDSGGCNMPPGRWECQNNVCTQIPNAAGCGDGKCEPKKGESKNSCPADCDFSGQVGEGKPCGDAFDCAFYDWPPGEVGYWDCAGWPWDRKCKAIHDKTYCGTEGQDYCYMTGQYLETDTSCPADCKKKYYNCGSDMECIFLEWK